MSNEKEQAKNLINEIGTRFASLTKKEQLAVLTELNNFLDEATGQN